MKPQKFPKWTHPSGKLKSPPLKKGDKGGFKESNPPCPPFSKGGDLRGWGTSAPSSLHWEVGNAFSAMFKRKRISFKDTLLALNIYRKIPLYFIDIELPRALELAHANNLYAYDAYVITCATLYRASLLTLDETLKRIALDQNIKVLEV